MTTIAIFLVHSNIHRLAHKGIVSTIVSITAYLIATTANVIDKRYSSAARNTSAGFPKPKGTKSSNPNMPTIRAYTTVYSATAALRYVPATV